MKDQLAILVELSWQAASQVMAYYDQPMVVMHKEDNSPLTLADQHSHAIICEWLQLHFPEIPVISEEDTVPFEGGTFPKRFFLVDPLDGTKEFVKRNGEFTTNIALIEEGVPVMGVVCAPALDILYYGARGVGAFKLRRGGEPEPIQVNHDTTAGLIVTGSRSHGSQDALAALFAKETIQSMLGVGSSLKFCLIAEGEAHVYPRLGTTMEWDTAAGQAVLTAAGGSVYVLETHAPLRYGKPGLKNPHFMATHAV